MSADLTHNTAPTPSQRAAPLQRSLTAALDKRQHELELRYNIIRACKPTNDWRDLGAHATNLSRDLQRSAVRHAQAGAVAGYAASTVALPIGTATTAYIAAKNIFPHSDTLPAVAAAFSFVAGGIIGLIPIGHPREVIQQSIFSGYSSVRTHTPRLGDIDGPVVTPLSKAFMRAGEALGVLASIATFPVIQTAKAIKALDRHLH